MLEFCTAAAYAVEVPAVTLIHFLVVFLVDTAWASSRECLLIFFQQLFQER